jgi:hypothetical protein
MTFSKSDNRSPESAAYIDRVDGRLERRARLEAFQRQIRFDGGAHYGNKLRLMISISILVIDP